MIYHDLTSKGGGMPMRTGIPLSAKVLCCRKGQHKKKFRGKHLGELLTTHSVGNFVSSEVIQNKRAPRYGVAQIENAEAKDS